MTDNFCIAPFIHLNNTPRGKIDPCCVWAGGEIGNMERGILDAWGSDGMVKLRNQFLNNERPASCIRCWAVEDSGSSHSFRIRANTDFKKYLHLKTRLDAPIWLQLKLGAKCNLTCRTCSSGSSNQWLKADAITAIKETEPKLQKKLQREYVKNKQQESSFIYEEKFWQELKDITPELEYITFTGGEPLLIDEHYDYLQWCVENNYAKNITLDYITNATIGIDDHKKNLWSNFKQVELIISMDGTGKLAEYIRTGLNWNEAEENIMGYKKYHDDQFSLNKKKFSFVGITFLVSIYNIFDMAKTLKFYEDKDILLYINYLHEPAWQNIRNLPNTIKHKLTDLPTEITNFMYQPATGSFTFCDKVKKQEEVYKQATRKTLNYEKLFPEWWEMLNENSTMRR
jgi:MoaA/NifB/PqqE/SkfB family radical SAM enzyme